MRNTVMGALVAFGLIFGAGCGRASDQSKARSGDVPTRDPQAASQNAAPGFGGTGGSGAAGQGTNAASGQGATQGTQSQGAQSKRSHQRSWYGSSSTTYQEPQREVVQSPITTGHGRLAPTGQGSDVGGGGVSGQLGNQSSQGGTIGGAGISPNEPSSAVRGNDGAQNSTVSTGQGTRPAPSNASPQNRGTVQ